MPTIHYSSFEAGVPLHSAEEEEVDPLIHGFLDQTRHVLVGVKAAIDRRAGGGLVDGARRSPPGSRDAAADRDALVVQCVIAIENEETHAGHFWIRDLDLRRASARSTSTWRSFGHPLPPGLRPRARAESDEVPVIDNREREKAIGAVHGARADRG